MLRRVVCSLAHFTVMSRFCVALELLGHADLRMTWRAYAHLLQKTLRRVVKSHLPTFGLESTNVKPLKRTVKKQVA